MPSKLLAIDTATKSIYLALVINGVVVDSINQEGASNHSVTIMPLIDQLLKKQSLTLRMIEGVLVGIGPGSYTGVRIGVAIAKMIGYLNPIEIYTFSSLALLATVSESDDILAYIDARRGNAFLATFSQKQSIMTVVQEDSLVNFEEYKKSLKTSYDEVSEGMPNIIKLIGSGLITKVEDVHALVPNYLQITEAERNKVI
jgi:tRNA threonylcarbamoyladenosine biosynthesis protein TsaB